MGGFQKNAAYYIFRHLLNSIGLVSNLQCSNYELPFEKEKFHRNSLSRSQDMIENVVTKFPECDVFRVTVQFTSFF